MFLLPSIPEEEKPERPSIFVGWVRLLRSATRYRQAFKLCVGWILWNTRYSNYLVLMSTLFLKFIGISSDSGVYTVWSFTSVLFACIGGLSFLFTFLQMKEIPLKNMGIHALLAVNLICLLWGCIGISSQAISQYSNNNIIIGYNIVGKLSMRYLPYYTRNYHSY
jgi:hypothetical protein